jgi:hypothetical protein
MSQKKKCFSNCFFSTLEDHQTPSERLPTVILRSPLPVTLPHGLVASLGLLHVALKAAVDSGTTSSTSTPTASQAQLLETIAKLEAEVSKLKSAKGGPAVDDSPGASAAAEPAGGDSAVARIKAILADLDSERPVAVDFISRRHTFDERFHIALDLASDDIAMVQQLILALESTESAQEEKMRCLRMTGMECEDEIAENIANEAGEEQGEQGSARGDGVDDGQWERAWGERHVARFAIKREHATIARRAVAQAQAVAFRVEGVGSHEHVCEARLRLVEIGRAHV